MGSVKLKYFPIKSHMNNFGQKKFFFRRVHKYVK